MSQPREGINLYVPCNNTILIQHKSWCQNYLPQLNMFIWLMLYGNCNFSSSKFDIQNKHPLKME